jgi:hypothetical protein
LALGSFAFFFIVIGTTWLILLIVAIRNCCRGLDAASKRAERAKKKATGQSSVKRQDKAGKLPGVYYLKRVAHLVHISEGYVDFVEEARYQLTAVGKATDEARTEVSKKFRVLSLVFHMILHNGRWVEGTGDELELPESPDTYQKKPDEVKALEAQYAEAKAAATQKYEASLKGGTQEAFVGLEQLHQSMTPIIQSQDIDEINRLCTEMVATFDTLVALLPEQDAELFKQWYSDSEKLKVVEEIVVDEEYFFDKTEHGVQTSQIERDRQKKSKCPEWLQIDVRHKFFYICYFTLYFILVFIHIVGRLITGATGEKSGDDVLQFTFLGVGEQYNPVPGGSERYQLIMVPAIFGVMHASLFTLALLPVPFARGVWRDLVKCAPVIRSVIPVDDLIFLHRMWGIILLTGIMTGASFWVITMGFSCLNHVPRSCFAFHPRVNFYFDPVENVLFLRQLVWITWFFIVPLMEFARNKPPAFCPRKCRQYWWEVAIYLHVFVAIFTTSLAIYARLQVFIHIVPGWLVYYVDKIRERLFHTHKVAIVIKTGDMTAGTSRVHLHSRGNLPVSVHTVLTLPKHYRSSAGQWIYFHVPGIDRTWHPFTLASASDSPTINLEIGIRGYKDQWSKEKSDLGVMEWTQPDTPSWTYKLYRLIRHTLYENRAQRRFNDFDADKNGVADKVKKIIHIDAYVRGPYGAAYEQSIDPKYGATILVGAGTGVTSPLSALRDIIARRKKDINVPNLVWFVWSTQAVDDLLWLWDSVFRTLYSAHKDGAIAPKPTHRSSSKTMDWLGLTIYISQADGKLLKQFVEATRPLTDDALSDEALQTIAAEEANNGKVQKDIEDRLRGRVQAGTEAVNHLVSAGVNAALSVFKKKDDKEYLSTQKREGPTATLSQVDVHDWMTDDKRLLTNSMDDKATHVVKLLKFVSQMVGGGGKAPISVAYCGPSSLSFLLAQSCKEVGNQFDFVSDTL